MLTLYRVVSKAEKEDFEKDEQFRTGRNTLEGKQFFKSEEAVKEYVKKARKKQYDPPYKYLLEVTIELERFEKIPHLEHELDRFEAVTIYQEDLPDFNKCIKFVAVYEI